MTDVKKKRCIVLQIEIDDINEAAWIWRTHMEGCSEFGIYVRSIIEGNLCLHEPSDKKST